MGDINNNITTFMSSEENKFMEISFDTIRDKDIFERTYNLLMGSGYDYLGETHFLEIVSNKIQTNIIDPISINNLCKNDIIPQDIDYVFKKFTLEKNRNAEFKFNTSIYNYQKLNKDNKDVDDMIRNWNKKSKIYTIYNIVSLTNKQMPGFKVDFIMKKKDLKGFKFSKSNVFNADEIYNICISLEKDENVDYRNVVSDIKHTITYVLMGIQNTKIPIKSSETELIKQEYSKTYGDKLAFIGPSSFTLLKDNLDENSPKHIPYVLDDYCVTDKADGQRRLLYISDSRDLYLISIKLEITKIGVKVSDDSLCGTIIDGEFITKNKNNEDILLFAAFDIYFIRSPKDKSKIIDVRPYEFARSDSKTMSRYVLLNKIIKLINKTKGNTDFIFETKKFYFNSHTHDIFKNCKLLFNSLKSKVYETDGIILTHEYYGVSMSDKDRNVKNYKFPWKYNFKWKPPEFNSIDFRIYIPNREIEFKFNKNTSQLEPYMLIHLYVTNTTSALKDVQNITLSTDIDISSKSNTNNEGPFIPTRDIDPNSYLCNVLAVKNSDNEYKIYTQDNELIEQNDIIEFKYDLEGDETFRWIPIRKRNDKLFPNAFKTAENNWRSMHHPVTINMLIGKDPIIIEGDVEGKLVNDKQYFTKVDRVGVKTNKLKKYHKSIKKMIYKTILSKINESSVIDYSIGRGGDLYEYIYNNVKYLLGIDIAENNIHSVTDSPTAKFINNTQNNKDLMYMFIQGNSSEDILTKKFSQDQVSKDIIDIIFGINNENINKYSKLVYNKMYNRLRDGFHLGSVQFSLHYFFENKYTLNRFAKNCHDTIKDGGYLTGMCFDGKEVFKLLKDREEPYVLSIDGTTIFSVSKKYGNDLVEIKDDNSCLGLEIVIFQETIGTYISEYLVNFEYFIMIMESYGFAIIDDDEFNIKGLCSFKNIDNPLKDNMDKNEKIISYLNKYFIFKKNRTINSDLIFEYNIINK